MPRLSIIILSYNTKDLTSRCLNSLFKTLNSANVNTEIIVVDNNSTDGSTEKIKDQSSKFKSNNIDFKLILNKNNVGYPKGNNQGLRIAQGEYILFLNSDIVVEDVNFGKLLDYLDKDRKIGVLTVKVNLSTNGIDPASHRGFPTIWNTFCYYSKLEYLTKKVLVLNKFFGGYHLTQFDLNTVHGIDSPSGAFYLTRKNILDKIGGFDEKFFMYGEDLDLSFRIKELGFKIIYYPLYKITHYKHSSGFRRDHFYKAMKIFYHKHYESKHFRIINNVVYLIIDLMKKIYA